MLGLPQVTLFFGGPKDTDQEAKIVAASVRTLAAHYRAAQLLGFGVWHWCGEDNPTTFDVREDIQDRVDQKLSSATANLVIVVFREKLGVATERYGQAYASSSAYELETALLGEDGKKKPEVGVFQFDWTTGLEHQESIRLGKIEDKTERERQFAERDERKAGRKAIAEYFGKLKQQVGPLSRMRYSDLPTFTNQLNEFLSVRLALIAQRMCAPLSSAPPQRRSPRPEIPGYPFRSMQSLGYEDYDIFHGRDQKLAELRERLRSDRVRFLCLAGPSGAGKSSMLKAGLIGGLILASKEDGGRPFWIIDMHPDRDPFERLQNGIERLYWCSKGDRRESSPIQAKGLREALYTACRRDLATADAVLQDRIAGKLRSVGDGSEAEILLVIDQLEELWTRGEDGGERRDAFLRLIAAAIRCPGVRVLTTLRSDIFPHFEAARVVAESLLTGGAAAVEHVTPPLIPDELEPMIRGTADAGGITLEPALVGALLTDAEAVGPSALPLLAFTLSLLVQQARGQSVTLEAYRAIGRLPGAIEHAVRDSVRQHLPDESDLLGKLAALFSHLVDMREMETRPMPVRMTRRKTELLRHGVDTRVIDALIDARVLHVGDHGGEGVMLAHDALFQKWKPLTEWIAQNQSDLEYRSVLSRDALEWHRHGRRRRFVKLGREALQDAQARAEERPDLFSHLPFIRHYLRAAARQEDKELFIQAINASSPEEALDVWERHGGELGLDPFEDRGTDAGQLRPGIYAAITGDLRPDAALWPGQDTVASVGKEATAAQSKNENRPEPARPEQERGSVDQEGKDTAITESHGAQSLARFREGLSQKAAKSLFDDAEHRDIRVTRGRGPMNFAAMFGRIAVLRKLIGLGENPHENTWSGHTLLGDAAYGGSLEAVHYLVEEQRCDIEEAGSTGSSPITWACQRGHTAVVDYLKSKGARFDVIAPGGWTCLTEASFGGHLQLVKRLIDEEHLDPHHPIADGRTALHRAAQGQHTGNLDVVRFLADKKVGVDRHKPVVGGWSALSLAVIAGTPEMIALLLELDLDPNHPDDDRDTPLHLAAQRRRGSLAKVKALLTSRQIKLDQCNDKGQTPLFYAAARGDDRLVHLLLAHGADPAKSEGAGWTPLHVAAVQGDLAVIETLCMHRGKSVLAARVKEGWTALMAAAQADRPEAITLLRKLGASVHLREGSGFGPLHIASRYGNLKAVNALIAAGAPIHALARNGTTPLGEAARRGHWDVVRALLEAGADPDARPKADFLLPVMAERNEIEACVHLLGTCATPNARDAAGRTALFVAVEAGNIALCRVLLQDKRVHVDARRWDVPEVAVEDDILGLKAAPVPPEEV